MFPGTTITFVSDSAALLEAAKAEGLEAVSPVNLPPVEPEPEKIKDAVKAE